MSTKVEKPEGKELATSNNPFGSVSKTQEMPSNTGGNAMMTAEMQRSVAEVQAQYMFAMHRPRNPLMAVDKMIGECQRTGLAEVALYSFARGGTNISGLSIRALEMVARNWGNIKYGFRCLERRNGVSLLQAYALDLENNIPVERVFEVKHWRDTKNGGYQLKDERDIYELEANQAQRRVRACLEALIPGDVLDSVEDEVKLTLKATADTSKEGIKKMLDLFDGFGVNQAMIEARIQRKVTAIEPAQMVNLRSVYNSLKDGMSSVDAWFDMELATTKAKESKPVDLKAEVAKKKAEPKKESVVEAEKEPEPSNEVEKEEPTQKERTPFDVEVGIRNVLKAATDAADLSEKLSVDYADDLEFIKQQKPAAYTTLKAAIDARIKELGNE